MSRPRLLLLDEPSIGLAPMVVREIFRVIADLRRRGATILLVEQNARLALQIADRGYVLQNGRVTLEGSAHELLASEEMKSAYLGRSAMSTKSTGGKKEYVEGETKLKS